MTYRLPLLWIAAAISGVLVMAMFNIRRQFPKRPIAKQTQLLVELNDALRRKPFDIFIECDGVHFHYAADFIRMCGFPRLAKKLDDFGSRVFKRWLLRVHGIETIPDAAAPSSVTCREPVIPKVNASVIDGGATLPRRPNVPFAAPIPNRFNATGRVSVLTLKSEN
jgi:hypothetical protein